MLAGDHRLKWLFIIFFTCGFAAVGRTDSRFDSVHVLDAAGRMEYATDVFRREIVELPPAEAEAELQQLVADARQLNDKELEVYALMWMGDYYTKKSRKDKFRLMSAYKTALAAASNYNLKLIVAKLTHNLGMHLYHMDEYPQAFEYLLNAHYMMQSIGFSNVPDVTQYIYDLGLSYYYFTDYKKSIFYLTYALQYPFPEHRVLINTFNTLALSYQNLQRFEMSVYYFRKTLETAREYGDSAWIGIASGNLGSVYQRQGYYSLARPLIMTDYELSIGHEQYQSAFNSLVGLARIDLAEGLVADARIKLDDARELLSEINPSILSMQAYHRSRAELDFSLGDYRTAYLYMDTANRYRDSTIAKNDLNILARSELKVETERYMAEMHLLDIEKRKERIMRNGIILVAFLLLVITYQIFNRQRLKIKKDNEIISLQKRRAEEELKNAEQQLHIYTQSLLEKNQLLDKFKEEVEQLQSASDPQVSAEKEKILDELYHTIILTEEDWSEFKRLFEKVHRDFFGKLKQKYPDLTVAETRLLALAKLRLSNNEMAQMLGISPHSVRKTSLRLRKKLDMVGQTDLTELVETL